MVFESPRANFKSLTHFACIVLKSKYLLACHGRQIQLIEIIFCLRKVEIS